MDALWRAAALRSRPTRSDLDWSLAKYAQAVRAADSGSLRQAADFVDWLMTDGRVSGAWEQGTAMFGVAPRFETDPTLATQLAVDMVRDFAECEQEKLFLWGYNLGIGAARVEYSLLHLLAPTCTVTAWDMQHFAIRRDVVDGATVDQLYAMTDQGEDPVTPGKGWIVFTPFGAKEPTKRGLWRKLARPVLGKEQMTMDRLRTSEVTPILVAETTGLSEAQRIQFRDDLVPSDDTRIVLPKGCKVSAVDVASGTRGTIQKDGIEDAKEEIATIINGTAVTTEGSSGFSNGDVQMGVAEAIKTKREQAFSTAVGEQYTTEWARIAYGYQGPAIYPRWLGAANAQADAPTDVPDGIKIDLTPSDIATVVKVDQFLASLNLPSIGGADGSLTVAQYQAKNAATIGAAAAALDGQASPSSPTVAAPAGASPSAAGAPPANDVAPSTPVAASMDEQTDESIEAYAIELTDAQERACEHGRSNKCTICGIERVRALKRGEDGEVLRDDEGRAVHAIQWRPITQARIAMAAATMRREWKHGFALASLGDKAPTRVMLFKWGENQSDYGPVFLTKAEAEKAIKDFGSREMMFDLEHLSLNRDEAGKHYNPDAMGSAKRLALDDVGMWAEDVTWTDEGRARIESKRTRYTSPAFDVDKQGRVIAITNCAITALPATRYITPLVAASATGTKTRARGNIMDEKTALMAIALACGLAPDATPDDVAKAAIGKMTGNEPAEEPAEPMVDPAAMGAEVDPAAPVEAMSVIRSKLGGDTKSLALLDALEQNAKANSLALSRIKAMEAQAEANERAALFRDHANKFTPESAKAYAKAPIDALRTFVQFASPVADTRKLSQPSKVQSIGANGLTAEQAAYAAKHKIDPARYAMALSSPRVAHLLSKGQA